MAYNTLLKNLQLNDNKQAVRVKLICKGKIEAGQFFQKTSLVLGDEKGSTIQATYYEDMNTPNDLSLTEDLYGVLVGVGDIEHFENEVNGGMPVIVNRRIQFSLINMQYTQIKCMAYGNVAQQLHDFWTSNDAYVVICVLQFWRIDWEEGGFNNVTTIEGFSKIMFDPEHVQEVEDFRKRIPNTAF